MEKIYYFDSIGFGFYIFPDSPVIPDEATEISIEVYSEFAGIAWPEGKTLGADSSGMPAWVDAPPPTHEEEVEAAEQHRQQLLLKADEVTADWRVELMLGDISEEDKEKLSAWMDYKKQVKAVDTSTAPDITWPTPPAE
ncbi:MULTISPECIES: tail fiber assembly protein [Enterobacteriaceae]|uniref:tail fiber assembly protein n=1 Tax=Enterobacteriaceae TaxID=543 RepID=UPI00093310A8|nr:MULTISPECIES: tail fiber assembly protein [Enterobacteriaceae]HCM9556849.1 tail fiber assembly protein [Enterobacter kobei]ELO3239276.1 tail fiber assembly protein [Escherichia coli]MBW4199745.1 tail fiber assembly protein [Enterobacter cloacae subsp. cloacae]MCE0533884.1 tail fiber assembly protein [Escherichia coli]MCE0549652.1 tail fiber assembly protein [Escherichia coli]